MLTPPTSTLTSTPLAAKAKPGDAVLSEPATGPIPVVQRIRTCPGLAGEMLTPEPEPVVKRLTSSCAAEMKFCTTARPLPLPSCVMMPALRCTTVAAKLALAEPLLVRSEEHTSELQSL